MASSEPWISHGKSHNLNREYGSIFPLSDVKGRRKNNRACIRLQYGRCRTLPPCPPIFCSVRSAVICLAKTMDLIVLNMRHDVTEIFLAGNTVYRHFPYSSFSAGNSPPKKTCRLPQRSASEDAEGRSRFLEPCCILSCKGRKERWEKCEGTRGKQEATRVRTVYGQRRCNLPGTRTLHSAVILKVATAVLDCWSWSPTSSTLPKLLSLRRDLGRPSVRVHGASLSVPHQVGRCALFRSVSQSCFRHKKTPTHEEPHKYQD